MAIRIDILTTFPELFTTAAPGVLGVSIPSRAIKASQLEVHASDIREFTENKHKKTDDRPFGGGPGMVMMCQPLWDCTMAVEASDPRPVHRVLLTPQGKPLTQQTVERLASLPRIVMICGHYEGIDERVIEALNPEEISIGDYVLSGGELGALVLIDAIARLLPGVLGDDDSSKQDSFSSLQGQRLLDCPHYTKPREWNGRSIPDVLVSGNHKMIDEWRAQQRRQRTADRRPDLLP